MKQIIPFKKELAFKTKVSEITSISLEREINIGEDSIVSGTFHISGEYKMNEGSISREKFNFDLPFDITLDSRYDLKTATIDIDNFNYDIINEEALDVNIDLFVDAKFLEEDIKPEKIENIDLFEMPDIKDNDINLNTSIKDLIDDNNTKELDRDTASLTDNIKVESIRDSVLSKDINSIRSNDKDNIIDIDKIEEKKDKDVKDNIIDDRKDNITDDLFSNIDSKETYTTYYVYIVKEEDTLEGIINKYEITKEDFEMYNEIEGIKPGDKVIIPKRSE